MAASLYYSARSSMHLRKEMVGLASLARPFFKAT